MSPGKRQTFANISLTRNTVGERISELAGDVDWQLIDKVNTFVAFLVATGESTYVTDFAQQTIFICGVDETLTLTEEFIKLVLMTDTITLNNIFSSLIGVLDQVGMDSAPAVGSGDRPCTIHDWGKRQALWVNSNRNYALQMVELIFGHFTVFYTRRLRVAHKVDH